MSTVAVVGAGSGGLVAANLVRAGLGREHRVVLIDRQAYHQFQPSFLWVMTGKRAPEAISRPLAGLSRKGIEFVNASVEGIDVKAGHIVAGGRLIGYDYLILAPGAELASQDLPGFSEEVVTPYSLEGATALRNALPRFAGGRLAVLVTSMPYKCPAAPYETALQIDRVLRDSGVREKTELSVYTCEPQPMPVAGPEMGAAVKGMLADKGIGYFSLKKTARIEGDRTVVFDDGDRVGADYLVGVPPHRLPSFCVDSGLAAPGGWLSVSDSRAMRMDHERVWAIGDAVGIKLPSGLPLPKAGVFAHHQAVAVAKTVVSEIAGKGRPGTFEGDGYCWIETGGPFAGYASGDFYADPKPVLKIGAPSRLNHVGKLLFEKWWLRRWF